MSKIDSEPKQKIKKTELVFYQYFLPQVKFDTINNRAVLDTFDK